MLRTITAGWELPVQKQQGRRPSTPGGSGTTVYVGTDYTPSNDLGADGDIYLVNTFANGHGFGSVDWQKVGGSWTQISERSGILIRDTVVQLRAAEIPSDAIAVGIPAVPSIAITKGKAAAFDGATRFYSWESSSTGTDDGTDDSQFIKPANVLEELPGRWEYLGIAAGGNPLTLRDEDGTPTVPDVVTIRVTNGKLTDHGAGDVSLDLTGDGVTFPIYYGMADSDLYTADNINSLSDDDMDTFLGTLTEKDVAGPEADGTKYLLSNGPSADRCFFWFIYPDHFGDIAPNGFEWAGGDVGAPTEVVKKFDMTSVAIFTGKHLVSANTLTDFATLGLPGNGWGNSNGVFQSALVDGNGWAYARRRVNGIYMRFYPFATWIVETTPAVFSGNSTDSARASNFAIVAYDPPVGTYPSPFNAGWVQVIGLSDSSFDVTQWAQDNETFFNLTYYNAGADVPNTGDPGGSFPQAVPGFVCDWHHGTGETFSGHFPSTIDFTYTEVSLFVTFTAGTGYEYTTLQVDSADLSVFVPSANRITVSNGAVVDDGDGHVTITIPLFDPIADFSFFIDYPEAKTYKIIYKAAFPGTIDELDIVCSSGTCTAVAAINGSPVTGTSSSVSATPVANPATANNVYAVDDTLGVIISALAFPRNVAMTIKSTRTAL